MVNAVGQLAAHARHRRDPRDGVALAEEPLVECESAGFDNFADGICEDVRDTGNAIDALDTLLPEELCDWPIEGLNRLRRLSPRSHAKLPGTLLLEQIRHGREDACDGS